MTARQAPATRSFLLWLSEVDSVIMALAQIASEEEMAALAAAVRDDLLAVRAAADARPHPRKALRFTPSPDAFELVERAVVAVRRGGLGGHGDRDGG
jgi:hypothetical protein